MQPQAEQYVGVILPCGQARLLETSPFRRREGTRHTAEGGPRPARQGGVQCTQAATEVARAA
ncbi:hypothetical protein GCM10027161_59760 [Microbispora hainanensis]